MARKRLDEILLENNQITEEQIEQALELQKTDGGKFGSTLLKLGFVDELTLLKALSKQFGCEGVILANLEIPVPVLKFIPKKIAHARQVIPFDYDIENNILKIACEDPTDKSLITEIGFVARGKKIKFYISTEHTLKTAINKFYPDHRDPNASDSLDLATIAGAIANSNNAQKEKTNGKMLLVSDDPNLFDSFKKIMAQVKFEVVTTDNADSAIDILGQNNFHTVFIKDTVPGDYIDLIDRARKISPSTNIRYFSTLADMLLEKKFYDEELSLMSKNLNLLTSILSSKDKLPDNHNGLVGKYVEKLCKKLSLPIKDCLPIINASYIHDLAKFNYPLEGDVDSRKTVDLTCKLLESINYSPVVIGMLKRMYANLNKKYTKRLPIEALGGNIITIVDMYCSYVKVDTKLSWDKFDAIKQKIEELTGDLFLVEVANAFFEVAEEELLHDKPKDDSVQIMVFNTVTSDLSPIEMRLKNEGIRIISVNDNASFGKLFRRSSPDVLVLVPQGNEAMIKDHLDNNILKHADLKKVPTFLLIEDDLTNKFTYLLEQGIEDIISLDSNLELLIVKLKRFHAQISARKQKTDEPNLNQTRGMLADMNLIDLLQALGPARRTAKITLANKDNSEDSLVIFLDNGNIIYSELGGLLGANAIYQALNWSSGQWVMEKIEKEHLPQPNNHLSNESILMEGCRLLDERTRQNEPA